MLFEGAIQISNSLCNVQVHYHYIINIELVPSRLFGNLAKSTFSAFATDDGFKFSMNFLLSLILPILLLIGTQQLAKINVSKSVRVGLRISSQSLFVKNLGVWFDCNLSMHDLIIQLSSVLSFV